MNGKEHGKYYRDLGFRLITRAFWVWDFRFSVQGLAFRV